MSRTCTCALEVAALVKDIGEEGPGDDIPVRRYTCGLRQAAQAVGRDDARRRARAEPEGFERQAGSARARARAAAQQSNRRQKRRVALLRAMREAGLP